MKSKVWLLLLSLFVLVACEKKNDPVPEPNKATPGLALLVGEAKYYSGQEVLLGEIKAELEPNANGSASVELTIPVRATDKSFVSGGYSVMVEKLSHLKDDGVGFTSLCFNVCPPPSPDVHRSMMLPQRDGDELLSIFAADDEENIHQNDMIIHYHLSAGSLANPAEKYQFRVTFIREGKVVYSGVVGFTAK